MPQTDDAIRLRAYYLFLAREQAGQDGTAEGDWLQAEAEGQEQGSPIGEAPTLAPHPAPTITTASSPRRA
jgi:hypothetical protein